MALAAASTVPLKHESEVELQRPEIRIADVVDLSNLGPAARAGLAQRIIARIPDGRHRISLSRTAIAALVRRSVPALRPVIMEGDITFTSVKSPPSMNSNCAMLVRPVAKGEVLSPRDLASVPCAEKTVLGQFRFERRNNLLRANSNIDAGASIGHIIAMPPPAVEAGARLTLLSRAGPVRIEREVVALQAGRGGGRIFVQDAEGQVTSLPLAIEQASEAPQ